ncbi:MAG: GNAT family N-acetyltransferase [Elusimicrobiota bacterium]
MMSHRTTSPLLRIRPAATQDGPRLADLNEQLGYPASPEEVSARLIKILSLGAGAVFVGESDGIVAGWIEIHQRPPLLVDGGCEAEIMGLVVDARLRRSGLGRKLITQAEGWAQARGCRVLRVRTNVVRQDAPAFYERLGFAKAKTQSVYKKAVANESGDNG